MNEPDKMDENKARIKAIKARINELTDELEDLLKEWQELLIPSTPSKSLGPTGWVLLILGVAWVVAMVMAK